MKPRILFVDDDQTLRKVLTRELSDVGFEVRAFASAESVLEAVRERPPDAVLLDLKLPGIGGLALLEQLRAADGNVQVVMLTGHGAVPEAVEAMRLGANDFLTKPVHLDVLDQVLRRAVEKRSLLEDNARLRRAVEPRAAVGLVGGSAAMQRLRREVERVARSESHVLIQGENGTGKELVARQVHALGARAGSPFVVVNCGAIPGTLVESELFGHERGAFTGAEKRREGRFRAAHEGTLFLDEVGEMSPSAQAKMLRALQDGTFQPLGSSSNIKVDVRTVAATNVDLRARIADNRFREDLFYRLKVFHLHVPALRERRADLPLLAEFFCRQLSPDDRPPPVIAPRAWAALSHYRFPGNVRELKHAIRHALVLSGGSDIDLEHLPEEVRGRTASGAEPLANESASSALQPLEAAQRQFEREYLLRALREADWNKTRVAQLLGISRKTLWQKLRRLGIDAGDE